jgi:hypothetical protein
MTENSSNLLDSQIKLFLLFNLIANNSPQVKYKKKSFLKKSKLVSVEKSTNIELLIRNKESLYNFLFFVFVEKHNKINYVNEKHAVSPTFFNKDTFKCIIKFNDFFEIEPLYKSIYLNNFFKDSNIELYFTLNQTVVSLDFLKVINNLPLLWILK